MTIYRGGGGTGEATTDTDITEVREIMIEAKGYRDEAEVFANAANVDSSAAEAAAADAAISEENAADSAASADADAALAESARIAAQAARDAAQLAETNAETAETNAATSAASALVSRNAALASQNAAASSASAALVSQNAAASSAAAALVSQNAAAASEAAALASQNAAAASQADAAASALSAAASWDQFDDRYLGAKASDPTVDNDGNTLVVGALYWNNTAGEFRAWTGTAWEGFGGLPSQDGAANKYLKSDGANANWSLITADEVVPSQTGNSGKFLTTNGSAVSWGTVPDPQPATPTDDGLVFGKTDSVVDIAPVYSGYFAVLSTITNIFYISTGSNGFVAPTTKVSVTLGLAVGDPLYMSITGNGYIASGTYYVGDFLVENDPGMIILSNPQWPATITTTVSGTNWNFPNVQGTLYTPSVGGNVSLGYGSSSVNSFANTVVGYGAGSSITTGSNLTVIGFDAEPSSPTATNEATLGNSNTTRTRLFGALAINDQAGSAGQVLTSNGSGSAPTWQTAASAPVTSVNAKTGVVVLTASDVGAATTAQGTNADTAFGWGNHALAGYASDSSVVKLTGDQTIAGTKTFSNSPIINAGTINQVQFLNASKVLTGSSNLTFNGTTLTAADITDSSLTSGRIIYAGSGGNLVDSANLTFNGTNLTALFSASIEGLTVGRGAGTVSSNTVVGAGALTANTTSAKVTAVGVNASKVQAQAYTYTALIQGFGSGYTDGTYNNVQITSTTGGFVATFNYSILAGEMLTATLVSGPTGTPTVATFYNVPGGTGGQIRVNATNNDPANNTSIGANSQQAVTFGGFNTSVGADTLQALTTGTSNTAVGSGAGFSMTTGFSNTFVGRDSGYSVTTGLNNTFLGTSAGADVTTGSNNNIIGTFTGNDGVFGYDIRTLSGYTTIRGNTLQLVITPGSFNSNNIWESFPNPTSKSGATTLTGAEIATKILQYTGGAATITMPTGTTLQTTFNQIPNGFATDWSVINTGSGVLTLAVNTGVTAVGALTVTNGTSATFKLRKTATNTFIMYRVD